MKIIKLIFNITCTISLLFNSAGQAMAPLYSRCEWGYSLRPIAYSNSRRPLLKASSSGEKVQVEKPRLSVQDLKNLLTLKNMFGFDPKEDEARYRFQYFQLRVAEETPARLKIIIDERLHPNWGKSGNIVITYDYRSDASPELYLQIDTPFNAYGELCRYLGSMRYNIFQLTKGYDITLIDQLLYTEADIKGKNGLTLHEGMQLTLEETLKRFNISASGAYWKSFHAYVERIDWGSLRDFYVFKEAAAEALRQTGLTIPAGQKEEDIVHEWAFMLVKSRLFNRFSYVNAQNPSWLGSMPDQGNVRTAVIGKLNEVISMPQRFGKFMLWGAEEDSVSYSDIGSNQYVDLERQYHFLERYAKWYDVICKIHPSSPFNRFDTDHYIYLLSLRYPQALSTLSLYKRLAERGLIDPANISRVMEIGTGGWHNALLFSRAFPNFKKAVGLEMDPDERLSFEKLWREVFDLPEGQYDLLSGNMLDIEEIEELNTEVAENGKFDLVQILLFKPEHDRRYGNMPIKAGLEKLFYQAGERLNADGVFIMHVKGEDRGILKSVRTALEGADYTELEDWHPDIGAFGVIGPCEVRVFVIKQPELLKIKDTMEHKADKYESSYDAITMRDCLCAIDPRNPVYYIKRAEERMRLATKDWWSSTKHRKDRKEKMGERRLEYSYNIAPILSDIIQAAQTDGSGSYKDRIDQLAIEFFEFLAVTSLLPWEDFIKTSWDDELKERLRAGIPKEEANKGGIREVFQSTFGYSIEIGDAQEILSLFKVVYERCAAYYDKAYYLSSDSVATPLDLFFLMVPEMIKEKIILPVNGRSGKVTFLSRATRGVWDLLKRNGRDARVVTSTLIQAEKMRGLHKGFLVSAKLDSSA